MVREDLPWKLQQIQDAAEAFYARLDEITLDELVCGNDPLYAIMSPEGCDARRAAACA